MKVTGSVLMEAAGTSARAWGDVAVTPVWANLRGKASWLNRGSLLAKGS